jgi:hypothetical protein
MAETAAGMRARDQRGMAMLLLRSRMIKAEVVIVREALPELNHQTRPGEPPLARMS